MIRYMVVVLARPIFGSHCLVEEQLLEIKFDWSTEQLLVRLGIATSASSTGPMLVVTDDLHPNGYMPRYMVVVLTRPILCVVLARPILADIESGTRENEVTTPWSQTPNLIQLVQGSPTTV